MSLVTRIESELATDYDNAEKNSERIVQAYIAAEPTTRAVLDDVFISLCGWSLETLMQEEGIELPEAAPALAQMIRTGQRYVLGKDVRGEPCMQMVNRFGEGPRNGIYLCIGTQEGI